MKAEWINPFVLSTLDTFRTMLECDVARGTPGLKDASQPQFEISGVLGMRGEAVGTIVLTLSRDVAFWATEKLLGETPTEIDDHVRDVVGELTNVVGGGAKARIKGLSLEIGLPTVVCGKNHIISFPTGVAIFSIPFDTSAGPFSVEIGLQEQDEKVTEQQEEAAAV